MSDAIEVGAEPSPRKIPEPIQSRMVPAPIAVDKKSQQIIARDNSELVRMIRIFMKGAALPKTLDTEEKVIMAWQAAASLRVPPIVAIQNMAIIHGTLSIWGQLPKALAHATGEVEECKVILFNKEQKVISLDGKNLMDPVWGAAVQMRRKQQSLNEYFFTEIEAQKAGLLDKKGPWQDYRKIMYTRRALGHAIKIEFPDAIMGLGICEYDFNFAPDLQDSPKQAREISGGQDKANEINSVYSDEAETKADSEPTPTPTN